MTSYLGLGRPRAARASLGRPTVAHLVSTVAPLEDRTRHRDTLLEDKAALCHHKRRCTVTTEVTVTGAEAAAMEAIMADTVVVAAIAEAVAAVAAAVVDTAMAADIVEVVEDAGAVVDMGDDFRSLLVNCCSD